MTIFLFLISILLVIVARIWNMRKIYKLSWKLPGPPALPIVGNGLHFLCKNEDVFDKVVRLVSKYPTPMRLWFGPKFTIVFSDVENASKVMSSTKFAHKDDTYRFMGVFIGDSLISGSGPKWKHDRKLISPMLAKKNVEMYHSMIIKHVNYLVKILENYDGKSTFDARLLIERFFADVIHETVVGTPVSAQDGDLDTFTHYLTWSYVISHIRILKIWLQVEWIYQLTKYYSLQEKAKDNLHKYMREAVQNHKLQGTKKHVVPTLLDQMIDLKNNDEQFGKGDLTYHLLTLFAAGEDPTAVTCSFMLVLVGMYPNIQQKIVEELSDVIRSKDIQLEDIDKLPYLDMCIKEILRLFPVAPFIMRSASENCKIGDSEIPKGCSVTVAIYNIHKDPKHWEKPNEFYPEHFLPEKVKVRHPYAYMPFSTGPRSCIGKSFAYLSMKIFLATVLRNFRIESDGTLQDIKLKSDISIRSKNDLYPIRIKRR